ncbi:MAG: NAD(P)H-dependent oxidoreductase [Lachnospiraceae bacterium]|nr:NAD(P)H-dependent oxidoreductase [Lachnospiraceae bacterium]
MTVIIHDLENTELQTIFPQIGKDTVLVSEKGSIKNCIGCFGCWIKTPGTCVLKDGYENMGWILSQAETVIIISKCYYGGYSPFVKNILDRSIPFLLPFFKIEKNETHHKQRYKNTFQLVVHFYGENITSQEMDIAHSLVKANAINLHATSCKVLFYQSFNQIA